MNYLFIHQNAPGQYRHLAAALARSRHNRVWFISQPNANTLPGIQKITYPPDIRGPVNCHAWTVELDRAIHTGAVVAEVCRGLAAQGFAPDLIVGHGGWGETLFVKDVYPDVPLLANFEFYYHPQGVDVGFDPEFQSTFHDPSQLRTRNGVALLNAEAVDWGYSATKWQRNLHPRSLRSRLSALHEGVDTNKIRPAPNTKFKLPSGEVLTRRDKVVTYVARNLEPYRGFHIFMRALPRLLAKCPCARVIIVGADGVSYGAPAAPSANWRELLLQELGSSLDLSRIHFLGHVDYQNYLKLLQISSAHVYLTYPFVLSWSFIEALASGCLLVGSSTPPVMEVLRDGDNGIAVDFFDSWRLAEQLEEILGNPKKFQPLRDGARATAVQDFDFSTQTLPRWHRLFDDLVAGRRPSFGG